MGIFDVWKFNKFLTLIPTLTLFLHIRITCDHNVGAIYYCIGDRIINFNWPDLGLLFFPLFMPDLQVIPPCNITIIARSTPCVLVIVAVHSGCCHIFYIWNHRLLGDPFWKLFCWCLGQFYIRTIYIGFAITFLNGPFCHTCDKLQLT